MDASDSIKGKVKLSCHCGAVVISVFLPNGLDSLRRCSCSICRRKGAIVASVKLKDLIVTQGLDKLTEYTFNTHTAKHYFCSVCGIYTHHQRRSKPDEYGVNVGCIEDIDITELKHMPLLDGVNHPCDRKEA